MTKLLYVLIVFLLVLAAFLTGYLFRQNSADFQPSSISSSLDRFSENNKSAGKIFLPKLERVGTADVLAAINSNSGKIIYIEKESGKIREVDQSSGDYEVKSGTVIAGLEKAVWSPAGSDLIYFTKNFSGPHGQRGQRVNYFSVANKKTVPLSQNINSVVFSPKGDEIAYYFFDTQSGEGNISISSPDGSVFKQVFKSRLPSIVLDWPTEQGLSFYKQTAANEGTDLFLLEIGGQGLVKILENKVGLNIRWSKSGNLLLYSFFDENGALQLALKDIAGLKDRKIPFATFADKCAFSLDEKILYCGVPKEAPQKPVKSEYVAAKDKIVALKLQNESLLEEEQIKIILEPSAFDELRVLSPFLSPSENKLFFINSLDGGLYRLNLNF